MLFQAAWPPPPRISCLSFCSRAGPSAVVGGSRDMAKAPGRSSHRTYPCCRRIGLAGPCPWPVWSRACAQQGRRRCCRAHGSGSVTMFEVAVEQFAKITASGFFQARSFISPRRLSTCDADLDLELEQVSSSLGQGIVHQIIEQLGSGGGALGGFHPFQAALDGGLRNGLAVDDGGHRIGDGGRRRGSLGRQEASRSASGPGPMSSPSRGRAAMTRGEDMRA